MALRLHVCLPSGLSCELGPFPPDSAVAELRSGAEKALGRPVRLIGPDGLLEEHLSLQSAKLHDHDTVGAIADWPKMASTSRAFVLWWGGRRHAAGLLRPEDTKTPKGVHGFLLYMFTNRD
ncbi:unnamed protein product [Durusdinium trenchii]|uniref:Ubiquitin-like domain-containing protein n=1 Tax=Durusdinium trenchii TaxID=1381693 RepID=A0ABP0Q818_9DINO